MTSVKASLQNASGSDTKVPSRWRSTSIAAAALYFFGANCGHHRALTCHGASSTTFIVGRPLLTSPGTTPGPQSQQLGAIEGYHREKALALKQLFRICPLQRSYGANSIY